MPGTSSDTKLIAELNDLLQLDHDAVEAYTIAIDRLRDASRRETLVTFRADHKRHIEELAALVRGRGGLPIELPHPTGALKLAVQALGSLGDDTSLLLAFKAVEGQVRDKYQRAAQRISAADAAEVVRRAADDEKRHYAWVERTLQELGAGSGTLPHGVASAVEGIHKLLADPIERVEREVMRHVGNVMGTTRSRGGAEAPLPTDGATPGGASASGRSAGTQQFIEALRELEETHDLERMVSLFDEESEVSNPMDAAPHRGQEGARRFWRTYRDSFEEIHSDFSRIVESDDAAMLEWTSRGVLRGDRPIDYSGVSVLELRGGKVRRFRTYFDARPFETEAGRAD
jgi:rubrerythrin/ketosteroid isomerase-like protein